MRAQRSRWSINLLTALTLLLAPVGSARAGEDSAWAPTYRPTLQVPKTTNDFQIDGNLDEAGWRGAGRAANFAEHTPGDQTQPPVETAALITYDADNLYVAFICYDDPSAIRATYCERDRIFSDDNIVLLLDTYGTSVWGYEIMSNPYGVQGDLLLSQDGMEDEGFDMVYRCAAVITDSGYQVEMAVPFSSLRFPDLPQQTWKVDFWRNHPRDSRRQYSWAAYDRNEGCWPCQWGTVTGIEDIQPGKGIDILPSFIAYQSGTLGGNGSDTLPFAFHNQDADGEISLNAKYTIASNMTAEATFNPDFSQVEADPPQIDVNTTTALSYAERRPFFQEGSDLFRTIFSIVYTRSVNDPQFAAKFIGRMNRTTLAYIGAYDENSPIPLVFEEWSDFVMGAGSLSNILRFQQAFGSGTNIGLIATDRRFDGDGSGTAVAVDGTARLAKSLKMDVQMVGTHTGESDQAGPTSTLAGKTFDRGAHTAVFDGESFWGHALFLGTVFERRNFYTLIKYTEKSPTFRMYNGYTPENDTRSGYAEAQYRFRIDSRLLDWIVPSAAVFREWNFDRAKKEESITANLEVSFKAQTATHLAYTRSGERFAGKWFDDNWNLHACVSSAFSDMLQFGGNYNFGHTIRRRFSDPAKIGLTSAAIAVNFKPINRLLIESSLTYTKGDYLERDGNAFEGSTARTRVNLQINRELSFRMIVQYDDFYQRWDIDPLLTYRISSFSMFYVGSTYDYKNLRTYDGGGLITDESQRLNSRQFFMKLQYLFQV